jgi:hypothetical protein
MGHELGHAATRATLPDYTLDFVSGRAEALSQGDVATRESSGEVEHLLRQDARGKAGRGLEFRNVVRLRR